MREADNVVPIKPPSELDRVAAALQGLPGAREAFGTSPQFFAVGSICDLVAKGYQLETHVLPVIAARLARARPGSIRTWSYFVSAIVDAAQSAREAPPPPAAPQLTPEKVTNMLKWFRDIRMWDEKTLGPKPGQPGCRIPAELLKPGDGEGWEPYDSHKLDSDGRRRYS